MPDLIHCPSCRRKLRLPESLQQRPVQCPTCSATFTAPATGDPLPAAQDLPPTGYVPPPPGTPGETLPTQAPVPPTPDARVACPACGSVNRPGESHCRVCGAELDSEEDGEYEERPFEIRRDAEPHRGPLILTLAVISLVCFGCFPVGLPLGIIAWVLGQNDLAKMQKNLMDVQGQSLTQAAWICGIIGTVLGLLSLLGCGAYFLLIFVALGNVPH
jgi:hypothetical protein